MQGREKEQFGLFGATPLDQVLAQDHPLRKIRAMFDEVWEGLAPSISARTESYEASMKRRFIVEGANS